MFRVLSYLMDQKFKKEEVYFFSHSLVNIEKNEMIFFFIDDVNTRLVS